MGILEGTEKLLICINLAFNIGFPLGFIRGKCGLLENFSRFMEVKGMGLPSGDNFSNEIGDACNLLDQGLFECNAIGY